jgi:hypothetical protein
MFNDDDEDETSYLPSDLLWNRDLPRTCPPLEEYLHSLTPPLPLTCSDLHLHCPSSEGVPHGWSSRRTRSDRAAARPG